MTVADDARLAALDVALDLVGRSIRSEPLEWDPSLAYLDDVAAELARLAGVHVVGYAASQAKTPQSVLDEYVIRVAEGLGRSDADVIPLRPDGLASELDW